MNKIAGLTIVSLPLAGMAGIGTGAFFSDTQSITLENTDGTNGSTLDLALSCERITAAPTRSI